MMGSMAIRKQRYGEVSRNYNSNRNHDVSEWAPMEGQPGPGVPHYLT